MPIKVFPHAQLKRVFVYQFSDPWTWADLVFAFDKEIHYSTTIPEGETYISLVIMRGAKSMAPGLSLSHFQYMQSNDPDNWDCMILVRDPDRFFNPLLAAASKFPGWQGRFFQVATETEAKQLIRKRRTVPI